MFTSVFIFTGQEYAAATLMLYEGLLEEGLQMITAVRQRFDGERRNPWDEIEGGHHYARAVAAWAPMLALSGFHYSAVSGEMAFAPLMNRENFRCFWSTPFAWGSFSQCAADEKVTWQVAPLYGDQELRSVRFALPDGGDGAQIDVAMDADPLSFQRQDTPAGLHIHFTKPLTVAADRVLTITALRR